MYPWFLEIRDLISFLMIHIIYISKMLLRYNILFSKFELKFIGYQRNLEMIEIIEKYYVLKK